MLDSLGSLEREEESHSLYVIRWCIVKCQNLLWCVTIFNVFLLRSIIWIIDLLLGLSTDHPMATLLISMTLYSIYWKKIAHHPSFIMGDFNQDLLKHELHRPTEKFLDIMYANSYIPIINRPTRVPRDTCTLIANIFANNCSIDSHFVSGILTADITDHYILFHILKDKDGKKDNNNEYKTVRIINGSRASRFIENIQNTDWSVLNSHRNCQTYFTKFYALFKTIYDGSFLLSRVKMRYRNRFPWLTEGLKKSIKYKNKLYRISLRHPTSYNISKYKDYKNKLSSIWKKETKLYYQSEIVSNKNNLRKVWAIIKQVINRKKCSKIHDKFMHSNKVITDPKTIANGFNNYFVIIGPMLASKIPDNNVSHRQFLSDSIKPSLFLKPTNETEIKQVISCLKEAAPGRDGLSSKISNVYRTSFHVLL